MKIHFTFICLLLVFFSSGQVIVSPSWSKDPLYLEFAKASRYNEKTAKIEAEFYKTASIGIDNTGLLPSVSIDVPDIFFIKLSTIYKIKYECLSGGEESISYTLISDDDKKFVILDIVFSASDHTQPSYAILTFTEKTATGKKSQTYQLTELK